jgi:hypothetical protein
MAAEDADVIAADLAGSIIVPSSYAGMAQF